MNTKSYGCSPGKLIVLLAMALLFAPNAFAEKYYEVGITLNRLLHSPDQFCTYMADHMDVFNDEFGNCVDENIVRRNNQAVDIWEACDNLHGPSDARTQCYEERGGADLETQVSWLQTMYSMTHQGADCLTFYYLYGWIIESWDPAVLGITWQEYMDQALPQMREDYACGTNEEDKMCFIATAVYGGVNAPEVRFLREFRDDYLLPTSAGREFVDLYYEYSPPIADYIKRNEWARSLGKWLVDLIIYSIKHPYLAFALTAMLALVFLVFVRRLRKFVRGVREV